MDYFMCLLMASAIVAIGSATGTTQAPTQHQQDMHMMQTIYDELKQLKQTVGGLARQTMLQQLFVEERIRSEGGSGLKQVRAGGSGTRPYHHTLHAAGSAAGIHEHSNYDRTVGLGELIVVLNGVEFRTRHNDYKLKMPSTKSKNYNEVEDIPFPNVPPSVLNKHNVSDQIAEMREFFKAFHKQDIHHRDYRPYFKPVMCYLEGGWTTDTRNLAEPFQSDRHHIDATSWFDLQEKVRYTSASGGKSNLENYSYLPTTIINVTDSGEPVYAQWNYRILCHPISKSLALTHFQPIDDLAVRMLNNKNMTQYAKHKSARFLIAPSNTNHYDADSQSGHSFTRRYLHGRLDDIMFEIPGKDNYNAYLTDNSFDALKHRVDTKNNTVLNVAKYHRHFKNLQKGAMGLTIRNRGFSDPNLFVSKTTNPKIAEMAVTDCHKVNGKQVCHSYSARHTYAIPLEVVWLTPLSKWNPYNLHFSTKHDNPKLHGRNGELTKDKAYNGTSTSYYYQTPVEFFNGGEQGRDPADTAKNAVGVLDQYGEVRQVTASGIRIFTPEIPGVGQVRIRYPVFPLHQEESAAYKNLDALQDIMMDMKQYTRMFERRPEITDLDAHPADTHYRMSTTHDNPPGTHYHDFYLTAEDIHALQRNGTIVSVYTTENNGHQHELSVELDQAHPNRLHIITCDGKPHCWDHHDTYAYKRYD